MNSHNTSSVSALRPVFMIGGSRTGSEMLKTILSASPELDFVDELFLYCPRWLHIDLSTNIKNHVGDLSDSGSLDRLMRLLYSGKPYGWFWSNVGAQLDSALLREELTGKPLGMREIFDAIMTVHAATRGKSGIGAKFPLHYSLTQRLIEWFPNCRLIHTTRNPKAVYASQAAKYLRADQSGISKGVGRFKQFVHINLQTFGTASLDRHYEDSPNYRLVRYEDVVREPAITIRKLCEFLEVSFVPEMLRPNQYGSSFDDIGDSHGINQSSLSRWKSSLSRPAVFSMDLMHRKAYEQLGYGADDE